MESFTSIIQEICKIIEAARYARFLVLIKMAFHPEGFFSPFRQEMNKKMK